MSALDVMGIMYAPMVFVFLKHSSPQLKLWPFNVVTNEISVSARIYMVVLQVHSLSSLVSVVIVSKNDKSVLYTSHALAK